MKEEILKEILNKIDFLISRQAMYMDKKDVMGNIKRIIVPGESIYKAWLEEKNKPKEIIPKLEEAIQKEKESNNKPDEKKKV
jgi:hypothetical protein